MLESWMMEPIVIADVPVSSAAKFFTAMSRFASRPELLIRDIRSTDLDWLSLDRHLRYCPNGTECMNVFEFQYSTVFHQGKLLSSGNVGELSGTLSEASANLFMDKADRFPVRFRRFVHFKSEQDPEPFGITLTRTEKWDFRECNVYLCTLWDRHALPLFALNASYCSSRKKAILSITPRQADVRLTDAYRFYMIMVFPYLIEWMSDRHTASQPLLSRLRSRPLSLIRNLNFWARFDLLRTGATDIVKSAWTECPDKLLKFIDDAIEKAAYISSFISSTKVYSDDPNESKVIDILDFGCGDGLLCYFLAHDGYYNSMARTNVVGFDQRKSRIWEDILPEKDRGSLKFVERTIHPCLMEDLIAQYSISTTGGTKRMLWVIGNNSDELTPWIPVMARRLNATGFFLIPCCAYDYFGKYERRHDLPGVYTYDNYLEYVCRIGDEFGYQPAMDKLRVPPFAKICLVGLDCVGKKCDADTVSKSVNDIMSKLSNSGENSSLAKLIARGKEESLTVNLKSVRSELC